jgi:hypothetical protein
LKACSTLDKIVAAHDLSIFVGQYHERFMSYCDLITSRK